VDKEGIGDKGMNNGDRGIFVGDACGCVALEVDILEFDIRDDLLDDDDAGNKDCTRTSHIR